MSAAQTAQTLTQTAGQAAIIAGTAMKAAWVPVVGPIVAGVGIAIAAILNRKGPKQKIAATQIVDDLEQQLRANVAGYMEHRTAATKAAALANFDAAMAWLESAEGCGNPDLGEPGRRCISERQRGGKWDWFSYYRDPIANDQPPADPIADAIGIEIPEGPARLLIPAALILGGLML